MLRHVYPTAALYDGFVAVERRKRRKGLDYVRFDNGNHQLRLSYSHILVMPALAAGDVWRIITEKT